MNGLCLRSHLAAGWMSGCSRGAIRPSANARPHSSPEVHDELKKSWHAPYSSSIRPSASSALTSVDGTDAPTRWLDNRLRCCTEHRPGAQVFQAKMLASEEAILDEALLRDLRSTTDLALRATKATAQAIRRLKSSLIVLECHLWLTMTEMKEADKVPFLDAPVSSRCTDLEHRSSRPRCSPVRKPV